jgi:hypothetical protein
MIIIPSVKKYFKNLAASKLVATDASKLLVSENIPLIGTKGGTGKNTITERSLLVGASGNAYAEKTIEEFITEFLGMALSYVSQYPTQDAAHVKATSELGANWHSYFCTDPALSLTGTWVLNNWLSNTVITDQRFHIDLGSAKVIKRIYYENSHNSGGGTTTTGAKNFTFWGSNDVADFNELTYAIDGTWTQIGGALQFDQHGAADAADPKYILTPNNTAYRYYAVKIADNWGDVNYIGLRRIVLQTLKAA